MKIENIILEISALKPTFNEITSSLKDIDIDYVQYLLDTFQVEYDSSCQAFDSTIEALVYCTDIQKVDIGGIFFTSNLDELNINGLRLQRFATFQENSLALNKDFNEFYYIDFYEPNNKPVVVKAFFSDNDFILALLYLLKLDVDFKFRNKRIKVDEIEKLSNIAGDLEYNKFFGLVYSQYE